MILLRDMKDNYIIIVKVVFIKYKNTVVCHKQLNANIDEK